METRRKSHSLTFDQAVEGFLEANGELSFLQVGGYDGVSFDPLRAHILGGDLSGLIVEPLPDQYAKLQQLYGKSRRIKIENCAVAESEGERVLWRFPQESINSGTLGSVFGGISSFNLPALLEDGGTLGGLFTETDRATLRSLAEPVKVQCCTFDHIVRKHGLEQIDLLLIDTGGYDFELLKCFDFNKFRPAIIQYEFQHLSPDDKRAAESLLISMGYLMNSMQYDSVAIRGIFLKSQLPPLAPVLSVAGALLSEGRAGEALSLYNHVLALDPANSASLSGSAQALSVEENVTGALRRLAALRDKTADLSGLVPKIAETMSLAIARFNELLGHGDLISAAETIDAMIALMPRETSFLSNAMVLAKKLGRWDRVSNYASILLAVDPQSLHAHGYMVEAAKARGDLDGEREHQQVLQEKIDNILFLQNTYRQISTTLFGETAPEGLQLVGDLIDKSKTYSIPPCTPPVLASLTYYRVALDCLDVAAIAAPTPKTASWAPLVRAGAKGGGRAINQSGLRRIAEEQKAEAIFFVAADRVYMEKYFPTFAKSIINRADINFLLVVLICGDADNMKETVSSINIHDPRIVYISEKDDAVTVNNYYKPEFGEKNSRKTYYQCARFLWLEYLMGAFNLPIMILDIDALLQGSAKSLLERYRDADVALNKNSEENAGARYTANLVLVNPSDRARVFARFLRGYLTKLLTREDADGFGDQVALLMAEKHLMYHDSAARMQYLDYYDINNIMYNNGDYNVHSGDISRYIFFALYGSNGDSALSLMDKITSDAATDIAA
ncbi:MAG: FkbM family methyltransferase [Rhodomicrobium sp.]